MHFEILVEGKNEIKALNPILSKILGPRYKYHSWKIRPHEGKGNLPRNPEEKPNRKNRTLLHNLPSKLRAYGSSLQSDSAVIVLFDLDKDDCYQLKSDLLQLLDYCDPAPVTLFRIAIEELEAWFLGDRKALFEAFPNANESKYKTYKQDSICGTWEFFAEIVFPEGEQSLRNKGWAAVLNEKGKWAKNIAPKMDVDNNRSPSFRAFRDGLKRLIKLQEK